MKLSDDARFMRSFLPGGGNSGASLINAAFFLVDHKYEKQADECLRAHIASVADEVAASNLNETQSAYLSELNARIAFVCEREDR